ncbi:MAG: translocation/assembly module TamB domain-containing protein [Candidatus Zipacnadales bacterium]
MVRRLFLLILAVVIPLGIMVLAGRFVLLQNDWAKRRLHEAFTIQLAQSLNAEVRIGHVSGNLATGFVLQDLAISEGQRLAEGVAFSARRMDIKCNLWPAIRLQKSGIETIKLIRIVGLRANLKRGPDGKLNVDRFIPKRRLPTKPPRARFRGEIVVENGELFYADSALRPRFLRNLDLHLTGVDAVVDFRRPEVLEYAVRAKAARAPFNYLEAAGSYIPATNALYMNSTIEGAELAPLYARFIQDPRIRVYSGLASASANVYVVPGEPVSFSVTGQTTDLTVELVSFHGTRISGSMAFTATPVGLQIHDADMRALGAQMSVTGAIFDFSNPTIDIEGEAANIDFERWSQFIPPATLAMLPDLHGGKQIRVAGRVTGPVRDPQVNLGVHFAEPVNLQYATQRSPGHTEPSIVTAAASDLRLAVAIPSIPQEAMTIQASAHELQLSDLGVLLPEQSHLTRVELAPLHDVEARIVYSPHTVATAGQLQIGEIATDQGALKGIDLRYALVGKSLRADVAVDSALGAPLTAQGVLDFSGEALKAYADFSLHNADLRQVDRIAGRSDLDLAGLADASGVLALHGEDFEVAADVFGREVRLQEIKIEHLAAQTRVTPEYVEVNYATATGPLGQAWARGVLPFAGPLKAEFAVTHISLAEVQAAAKWRADSQPSSPAKAAPFQLTGTGFAHGVVEGDLESPQAFANLAIFDGGVHDYVADVATAAINASPNKVQLTDVRVCKGTGVLEAEATLSEIEWPTGSIFADKHAGTTENRAVEQSFADGTLTGFARIGGLDLSQLAALVELPSHWRLAGVVESPALHLSGTLRTPQLSGDIFISHVKASYGPQEISVGPFSIRARLEADQDAIRLLEGTAASAVGSLQVTGSVSGWNAEEGPVVLTDFVAHDLPISAYLPAKGPAALIEGTVRRLAGSAVGPLVAPWPTVTARLEAEELRFGRRSAQALTADLRYEQGTLAAYNVGCDIAGGQLTVRAASYHPGEQKLFAQVSAKGLSASEALFLLGDIAQGGRTDADSLSLRDRFYAFGHRIRGTLSVDEVLVGGTLTGLQGRVKGLLAEQSRFDGKPLPRLETSFRFAGLAPLASLPAGEASRFAPALAHLRVDDLQVVTVGPGEGQLTIGGSKAGTLAQVHLDGTLDMVVDAWEIPVDEINAWLPEWLDVGGEMSFTVAATGPADSPKITASANVRHPTVAGVTFDTLDLFRIDVEPDAIVLAGSLLKRDQHELRAVGRLPFNRDSLTLKREGEVALRAQANELPLGVILELANEFVAHAKAPATRPSYLSQCKATGLVTALLDISGDLNAPEIDGHLYLEDTGSLRLPNGQRPIELTNLGFDARFARSPRGGGVWIEINAANATWDNTRFLLSGVLDVSHLALDDLLSNRMEGLTLTVSADSQQLAGTGLKDVKLVVNGHTDEEGWHVFEVQEGSATVGRGTATLEGVVLVDTLEPKWLGHVPCDLRLVLRKAEVEHDPFIKRAQLDGIVVARKFASRTGRALPEWFLARRVTGDSLEASAPILVASIPADRPSARQPIEISKARIGMPSRAYSETGDRRASASGGKPSPTPTLLGAPASFPSPQFDITFAIGHHVHLNWPIIKAEFIPDPTAIVIRGTPQAPTLQARASLRAGSLRLLRGSLSIPEAHVTADVTPAPYASEVAPRRRELTVASELRGRAEGTISGTTFTGERIAPTKVTLQLTGELGRYRVSTESDRPLSDEEIYSLLAMAPLRPGHEVVSDRDLTTDEMIAQSLATRAMRGVLEPLQEELADVLGLEEFEVIVGLNQPVQFRIGKYLIDDLLISYTRSAGGPEEQFDLRLSYNIKDRYSLSWHTDERKRQQIGVEYRWSF